MSVRAHAVASAPARPELRERMTRSFRRPARAGGGALAENIVHFARALREAGVPLGPGAVLDALAAVEAAGFGDARGLLRDAARGVRQEA